MYKDLKELVQQHSSSVAELFSEYGITAPVNEFSLAAAIHKFGDEFCEDLNEFMEMDFAGFKTKAERQANRQAKKEAKEQRKADRKAGKGQGQGGKTPFGQTAVGSFLKGSAMSLLTGLVGGGKSEASNPTAQGSGTDAGAVGGGDAGDDKDDDKKKDDKTMWIIGGIAGGVAILLLILAFALPGKSTK